MSIKPGLDMLQTFADFVRFRGGHKAAIRESLGQEILINDFTDLVIYQGIAVNEQLQEWCKPCRSSTV